MTPFARWFRGFLRSLSRRSPTMTLTPDTQAKLDKAFADKSAAVDADKADAAAADALTLATAAKGETADAALSAHQAATASAHDALAAVAAELGFTLPG